ncbi:hypothetical protein BSKO_12509 [Bryopsis sp. KO-2023]|nr:hypothetical protein BSKO_12509 [Bryopsis sp. KO-2023]
MCTDAWSAITRESCVNCWLKSGILPVAMHASLKSEYGIAKIKEPSLDNLVNGLQGLKISPVVELNGDDAIIEVVHALEEKREIVRWLELEDSPEILQILRNEAAEEILQGMSSGFEEEESRNERELTPSMIPRR